MGGTRAMANQDMRKDVKFQKVVGSLVNSDNGLLSNMTSATISEKGKALFIPDFISHSRITTYNMALFYLVKSSENVRNTYRIHKNPTWLENLVLKF